MPLSSRPVPKLAIKIVSPFPERPVRLQSKAMIGCRGNGGPTVIRTDPQQLSIPSCPRKPLPQPKRYWPMKPLHGTRPDPSLSHNQACLRLVSTGISSRRFDKKTGGEKVFFDFSAKRVLVLEKVKLCNLLANHGPSVLLKVYDFFPFLGR